MQLAMACWRVTTHLQPTWPRFQVVPPRFTCLPKRVPAIQHIRVSGFCFAAVLSKEEKNEFLAGVQKENVAVVSNILQLAKKAADRWEVAHSDFLTPPVVEDALLAVNRLADVAAVVSGGYAQAERCRLSVGHSQALEAGMDGNGTAGFPGAVSALSISGNFIFDPSSHQDFLGAIVGTGISREKLGDIIVQGEKGALAIVVPELVEFLVTNLKQVRTVSVTCEPIPLSALQVRPAKQEVLRSVEASLRVDALASAGFRISRSKLVELISGGDVKVNWNESTKGSQTLKSGDIVSIRGKGRLEVGEVTVTKKGRYAVELKRFV